MAEVDDPDDHRGGATEEDIVVTAAKGLMSFKNDRLSSAAPPPPLDSGRGEGDPERGGSLWLGNSSGKLGPDPPPRAICRPEGFSPSAASRPSSPPTPTGMRLSSPARLLQGRLASLLYRDRLQSQRPDLDRHLLSLHRSSHLLDLARSDVGLLLSSVGNRVAATDLAESQTKPAFGP